MRKLLSFLLLTWLCGNAFAQSRTISGKVVDENGGPLPGVTITLNQTQKQAATDANGLFKLNLGNETAHILTFTFLSYAKQQVDIAGKTSITVKMQPSAKDLTEVVVTGLNIPRTKASLTASVQSVNMDELTQARSQNISDMLDGKVAGLQTTTSGQPTGSVRLVLRGPGSITGNNQPLWVVDGVPIDNTDSNGQVGNLDYGNNAADLNPDDIESIEVLKGPNAAAIYGSKAANGAILVTTKKGKKGAGMGISYNGNYMVSQVLQFPDIQNVYGEGGNVTFAGTQVGAAGQGVYLAGSSGRNYGAPMLGQPFMAANGQIIPYSPQANAIKSLFQRGGTSVHNISMSNATDNSNVRFSYTRTDATDIIQKQNQVAKNNFQFNAGKDFSPRIKIEARIQYVQETVKNRTFRNEDPSNPMNYINNALLNVPLSALIPWKDAAGNAFNFGGAGGFENPYWDINENGNQDIRNTIIGGVTATFKLAKGLTFRAQESANLLWGNRNVFIQKGGISNLNGSYSEFQQNNRIWNSQGLLMFNKNIKDFSLVANAGAELRNVNYYNTQASTNQLQFHDIRNIGNTASVVNVSESPLRSQVQSLFATANIGYKGFVFLDLTARNDWSSTLPIQNASFFYPSIGSSFIFTEVLKSIPKSILSYGKVRASIARVGNDTNPYNLYNNFVSGGSFNGVGLFQFETQLKNSNLKPELTTSTEIGLELHFLNERISLQGTVYKSSTINQLLNGAIAAESGFQSQFLNAGNVQNKGIEISLTGAVIKQKNFQWDVMYNFSANRNKVLSLSDGITQIQLGGAVTAKNYAEVGKPLGVIRAEDQMISSAGYPLVNPTNGNAIYTSAIPGYAPIMGYAVPNSIMSFGSTFRYKQFSFNFLTNARFGGVLFSGTGYRYIVSGVARPTLEGREDWLFSQGVLGENVNEQKGITANYNLRYPDAGRAKGILNPGFYPLVDAKGNMVTDAKGFYVADLSRPNTWYLSPSQFWVQANHLSHYYTYDDSYIKLSQVIFTYALPARMLRNTVFRSASISAVGRNLWYIYQKTPKGIDPESAAFSGNAQGLEQGGSLPYVTYGLDLKLTL